MVRANVLRSRQSKQSQNYINVQGRIQDFWKGGGVHLRSTSQKRGICPWCHTQTVDVVNLFPAQLSRQAWSDLTGWLSICCPWYSPLEHTPGFLSPSVYFRTRQSAPLTRKSDALVDWSTCFPPHPPFDDSPLMLVADISEIGPDYCHDVVCFFPHGPM